MNRELISCVLNGLDERHIRDTADFSPGAMRDSPERIAQMKKKRIITLALAAALLLALGVTAYAASELFRSTGTCAMPGRATYTSLTDLPQVEKSVGYPVTAVEEFSNGFRFAGLRVEGEAIFDENNEPLTKYYSVQVNYSRLGAEDIILSLTPVQELADDSAVPVPRERRILNGVAVDLNRDHYKLVPEDYEKTEEDRAREASGHYFISFTDGQNIREYDYAFALFELSGVEYTLLDMAPSEDALDNLAKMAEELIAAGSK